MAIYFILPLHASLNIAIIPCYYLSGTLECTQMFFKLITQPFIFVSIAVKYFDDICGLYCHRYAHSWVQPLWVVDNSSFFPNPLDRHSRQSLCLLLRRKRSLLLILSQENAS